ncbi:O-antigen polymerase [Mucilaginibacter agri]|uniref:O-antigen polysaccharide polymerase Wzy n=1 Tax=Mucilaginibacter agri TaxID=2695265 RepID=A0A965ZJ94_9SPHI|nr:O-antigen polymerase [Mucilaginibacter agri]NCD70742.1 O-antigen polysaccharide polymerase Wzy [Mucilaginibacter agri]
MELKPSQLVSFVLLLEAILVYYFAPTTYNYGYSVFCSILYFINIIAFFILKRKKNYLDFDSVFFVGYFFVTLFYPVFMYENDPTRFFAFQFDFDANVIPQASALSLLGITSYITGSFLYSKPANSQSGYVSKSYVPNQHLSYFASFIFILYVLSGGYTALKGAYSGDGALGSGMANYIFIFVPAFILSAIILEFNNLQHKNPYELKLKNIGKTTLIAAGSIVFIIISTGSRTVPMQIILLVAGLYTLFYRPVSFPKFILLIIVGMAFMFLLVLLRGYQQEGTFSVVDIAMDLIINNRNSYTAIEYVNKSGLTYGLSMSSSFLAPVPFLQNFVISLCGLNPFDMSSSIVITKLTLGEVGELGLGTNIIADIYMSFGSVGVIMLMSGLGFFISMMLAKATKNIYALVCYGVMMSYAVFLVRAEFFFFLRYLIWSLIIVYLSRQYKLKFSIYKNK